MENERLYIPIPPTEKKIPVEIYEKIGDIILEEIKKQQNPKEFFKPYLYPFENICLISESDNLEYKENIRSMADDLWSKNLWLDSLIVYYILMHITTFLPTDFYKFAYCLAKLNQANYSQEVLNIYENLSANKKVACHAIANFYYMALDIPYRAIEYFNKYLEFDPNNAQVYLTLGHLYSKIDDEVSKQKQLDSLNRAYELDRKNPVIIKSLLTYYEKKHNVEMIKKLYPELIEVAPSPRHSLNYGLYLIGWGQFEEGHKYFTERFDLDEYPVGYPKGVFNGNLKWNYTDDISKKILAIHWEEGFGDSIMYGRFVPFMKKYAKKVVLIIQPELIDIFKSSKILSDGIEIISDVKEFVSKYKVGEYVHMPILDIPYVLKTNKSNIPYSEGYIVPTDMNKFNHNKINIGIAYSGDGSSNYNARNVGLENFYKLSKMEDVQLYSLQKGDAANQLKKMPSDVSIIDLGSEFKTFSDTVSAIAGLDFIITSDNVILNLAGAMGKLTLGLFNKYPNYRWFDLSGGDTVWYKSVVPFVSKEENDWTEVMENVYASVYSAVLARKEMLN